MKKTSLSDKKVEYPLGALEILECYPSGDVKEAIKDILEFPAGNVEALKQKIRIRCGKELCSEEESE